MSSYAPDVRQFNKQRHADAQRHEKHLQRQQNAASSYANSAGLCGITRTLSGLINRISGDLLVMKGGAK